MSDKPEEGIRLQKVLAQAGLASRRAAEEMIAGGRVEVNGELVIEQGRRVDPEHDEIRRYLGHVADRFDLDAVRAVVEDPDGDGHPLTLWKGLADQGALAVLVPEEHDGLGLGLLDAHVAHDVVGVVAPDQHRRAVAGVAEGHGGADDL